MGAALIKQKREARKQEVQALKDKMSQLEKETMYAPDYKREKLRELRDQLNVVSKNFDGEIKSLIEQSKNQTLKAIDQEQYALSPEEVNKQLLMEIRNQSQADSFYSQWKESGATEDFIKEAQQAIEHNFSNAAAYVTALKRLGHESANELEQQFKVNTRTPKQKMHYEALEAIESEAKAYEVDVVAESDPFKAALMSHYNQPQNAQN